MTMSTLGPIDEGKLEKLTRIEAKQLVKDGEAEFFDYAGIKECILFYKGQTYRRNLAFHYSYYLLVIV